MASFQDILECCLLYSFILVIYTTTMITSLVSTNDHQNELDLSNTDFLYHNQEDKKLVENLRSGIIPPANAPYNLKGDKFDPSQGQGRVVRRLTDYKTNGFFVECGGGNGEFFSNTLFLEKHLGWTGLLVEADPDNVRETLKLNRKSWVAPFCMSLNTSTYNTYFEKKAGYTGRIIPKQTRHSFKVRCYPFLTFLLALNVSVIDYFSLDVEGHEVEVLETVPFDKVDIDVLSVEFSKSRGRMLGVKNFMEGKGYRVVMEVPPDDLIFVKNTHPVREEEILLL